MQGKASQFVHLSKYQPRNTRVISILPINEEVLKMQFCSQSLKVTAIQLRHLLSDSIQFFYSSSSFIKSPLGGGGGGGGGGFSPDFC